MSKVPSLAPCHPAVPYSFDRVVLMATITIKPFEWSSRQRVNTPSRATVHSILMDPSTMSLWIQHLQPRTWPLPMMTVVVMNSSFLLSIYPIDRPMFCSSRHLAVTILDISRSAHLARHRFVSQPLPLRPADLWKQPVSQSLGFRWNSKEDDSMLLSSRDSIEFCHHRHCFVVSEQSNLCSTRR